MRTVYYTAATLDGFIADDHHSLDWLLQLGEIPGSEQQYEEFLAGVGALAMGSSTYRWVAEELDLATHPERWPYAQPTWVFTHRPPTAPEGPDLRWVAGDVAPVHAAMAEAAAGRDLWLVGGGDLVGQFVDAGLLDELVVGVAPVLLGSGRPLLPRRLDTPPLELVDLTRMGPMVSLRYRVPRPA